MKQPLRTWQVEVHRLIEVSTVSFTIVASSEANAHRIALGKAQENDGHANRFGELGLTYQTKIVKEPKP